MSLKGYKLTKENVKKSFDDMNVGDLIVYAEFLGVDIENLSGEDIRVKLIDAFIKGVEEGSVRL